MTTVYLIRHAQAEGNVRQIFQGHYNGQITDFGARQLACLRERFSDISLDAIYSSPLSRAVDTAQAVNHQGLAITELDYFIEINGGKFEGESFEKLRELYPVEFARFDQEPHLFAAPGGEPMTAVFERMVSGMAAVAARHPDGTVAVASHGCAIRSYLCFAGGYTLHDMNRLGWCDNTAVNRIDYDDAGNAHLIFMNDTTHLPLELLRENARNLHKDKETVTGRSAQ